ncbi:TAXI family TRAP transporter solute-binding subunit [Oceanobacillus luteolus]|uniref:TAXI family TRAP transporter solute-binding subunit n=1 Tax=Oceanobacillus luteolus TaxID=1274358 RepID=A0ABW4HZ14_9BACI
MNKKTFISILLLLFLSILAGCEEETESSDSNGITTTIKGGRTGGAWAVFTEGIAESVRRENDSSYITVEPGSIVENPPMVGLGRVPYGLSYAMTAYAAYRGVEPYDQAFENIRAVSVVIPANYYQFFVRKDVPYDSLHDIVENQIPIRLAVNQKGSDAELITRETFHHFGITYENIISWGGSVDYLSGSKAFEMMADGRIDAAGNAESAPSGNIIEASTTIDLKMVSLDKETIETVSEKLGMEPNTIPAGTYDFQKEDIDTVSTPAILIVHKDVSDEEVYAVTKSIYNNLNYLQTVHDEFKELTEESMINVGELPLHPGAEKFYKDIGILAKDE